MTQPAAVSRRATRSSARRPVLCRATVIAAASRGTGKVSPAGIQRSSTLQATGEFSLRSVGTVIATAQTFTLDGISARPVRVEVDVHRGLPGFAIVGLPDAAVREARERVRAALVNCGFEFPLRRIVVNLAPASLRYAEPGTDLGIAAALLSASGQLPGE